MTPFNRPYDFLLVFHYFRVTTCSFPYPPYYNDTFIVVLRLMLFPLSFVIMLSFIAMAMVICEEVVDYQVNMLLCLERFFWLTSASRSMFPTSARPASTMRRLRQIRRSLSSESAMTLVRAFVTSRVDYCNVVFAGAPKIITNKLQRVLNSAARVVSGTRKFDRGLRQLQCRQRLVNIGG